MVHRKGPQNIVRMREGRAVAMETINIQECEERASEGKGLTKQVMKCSDECLRPAL